MRLFTSMGCSCTSKPATVAVPAVGGRKQVSTRMVVVFPAPLGPRKPTIWPFSTSNEMLSTATVRAYRLVRPSTLIIRLCPRLKRRSNCHLGSKRRPERAAGTRSTVSFYDRNRTQGLSNEEGAGRPDSMPMHSRLFLRVAQKHRDAAGSPCGNSAPEEIGVFCPDGASDRQCRGQYRPVLRIPPTNPFAGVALKLAVNFASNQFDKAPDRAKELEGFFRIAIAFDNERRQVLFGFSVRHLRHEKSHLPSVRLDHLTYPLSQDSPHQYIGVNDDRSTGHSVSSRGLLGGSLCTPPSTRLRRRPRTRSFRPGPSQRRAWPPLPPSGFVSVQGCKSPGSRRGA